jgi:aquaporin Z
MFRTLWRHLPEYVMEALGLGLFMGSAGAFATLLFFPESPVYRAVADPLLRRGLMGVAMGLTLVALVYSPWGKQSGAHLNPAVTLTFWGLGKVSGVDAVYYILAQFTGGVFGVVMIGAVLDCPFL